MTGADAAAGLPLRPSDPTEFGRYRLLRRLGEGGMGSVYLATQVDGPEAELGRLVALKVIRHDLAHEPDFRRRFRSEVARAQQVPPFCTAEVLDADADHDPPYLVVEFVDGPTLAVVVQQRGPLSAGNLHGLAIGVATALTAIHGAGVIHRDLKPANVLLAPGSPKVIDFGIARAADGLTATHTGPDEVIGTIAYMAPERLEPDGVRKLTPAADVFAWGAVVTYAGTGRTPFGGSSAEAALRILTQPPDLTGLTGTLRELVERALDKDPTRRPTSRELLDQLLSTGPRPAPAQRSEPPVEQPAGPAGALIVEGSRQALVSVPEGVPPTTPSFGQVESTRPVDQPAAAQPAAATSPQLLQEKLSDNGQPRGGRRGRVGRRIAVSSLVLSLVALAGAVGGLATGLIKPVDLFAEPGSSPTVSPAANVASSAPSPTPSASLSPTASPSVSASPSASASPSPVPGLELFTAGDLAIEDGLTTSRVWKPTSFPAELVTCTVDGALVVEHGKRGSYRCLGLHDIFTDVAVSVRVTLRTPGSCAGLWFRYVDGAGGYALRICEDMLQLIQHGMPEKPVIVPIRTFSLSTPIALGSEVLVGVTAKGTELGFFLDNQRKFGMNSSLASQGKVVLGSFTVTPATGTGPLPPYIVAFRDIKIRDLS